MVLITVTDPAAVTITVAALQTVLVIVDDDAVAVAERDFDVEQGEDVSFRLTFQNPDASAFDLTGYTVRAVIKKADARRDADPEITKDSGDTAQLEILTPTTNGLADLKFVRTDTNARNVQKLRIGIITISPTAQRRLRLRGDFNIGFNPEP